MLLRLKAARPVRKKACAKADMLKMNVQKAKERRRVTKTMMRMELVESCEQKKFEVQALLRRNSHGVDSPNHSPAI